MGRYFHHGSRIIRRIDAAPTRDSASEPISVYSEGGGPRREGLPTPPQISMPSPENTWTQPEFGTIRPGFASGPPPEYRATSEPPAGLTAAELARYNERFLTQANGLPEVERNRRAGVSLQASYDAFWAKKPAFAPFGAKARDEGSLWRTICELGQPDGSGDLAGTGEDGRNYRLLRTDGGFTLEQEEVEDVALQPIGDRRAVSSKDSESAALTKIQAANHAFWQLPFRQR